VHSRMRFRLRLAPSAAPYRAAAVNLLTGRSDEVSDGATRPPRCVDQSKEKHDVIAAH